MFNPSKTCSKFPPLVIFKYFFGSNVSSDTLILFIPFFLITSAYLYNCVPLVVSVSSSRFELLIFFPR